jgi:four helix bundle protein
MDDAATKGPDASRKFDLTERTARFGEAVLRFARQIRVDVVSSPLIRQLVRAATSIGANYAEADEASSKKEFRYRINVCVRESRETKHWLRMMAIASPDHKETARRMWKEADELNRIFATIHRRSRPPSNDTG